MLAVVCELWISADDSEDMRGTLINLILSSFYVLLKHC